MADSTTTAGNSNFVALIDIKKFSVNSYSDFITLLFIQVRFLQKPQISLAIPTIKYYRT